MSDHIEESMSDALELAGAIREHFDFDLLASQADTDEMIFAASSENTAKAMGLPWPLPELALMQPGQPEHSYFMSLRGLGVHLDQRRKLFNRLKDVRLLMEANGIPAAPRPGQRPSVERRVWLANHSQPSQAALHDANLAAWSKAAGHDLSGLVLLDRKGNLVIDYGGEAVQLEQLMLEIDLAAGQWIAAVQAYTGVCESMWNESIDANHAQLVPQFMRSTLARSGSLDSKGIEQILRESVQELERLGARSERAAKAGAVARGCLASGDWQGLCSTLDSFHGKVDAGTLSDLFSGRLEYAPYSEYPLAPANRI